jgi:hypothetical protein
MRGSWNQPDGDNRPLSEKIKSEVDSAFRLLFKNVSQYAVPTDLAGNMVVYVTDMYCETVQVPLDSATPVISSDPVSVMAQNSIIQSLELLPAEAPLSESYPCDMEPTLCHEPVLETMELSWAEVTFENMQTPESHEWPLAALETGANSMTAECFSSPATKPLKSQDFKTAVHNLTDDMPPFQTVNDPRFYGLPIKKSPIQPHRFSPFAKEIFRKALAEKANTHPNNVQLRIVFERMDMTLFSGIQQDEQGNLLCTPKNELIGRNRNLHKNAVGASNTMYLVYGFRLDNKEDIRALVPASSIKIPSGKTKT